MCPVPGALGPQLMLVPVSYARLARMTCREPVHRAIAAADAADVAEA